MAMESIPFDVKIGHHSSARAVYLPYGTRTLRIAVTNKTDQPQKMWLRPERTPVEFPATLVHGYGDNGQDLWIHWAGGDEIGACVKTDEKKPLRDRSFKFWEVIPVDVKRGETCPTFVNVTHSTGDVKPHQVTLRAFTMDNGTHKPLDSTLTIQLDAPKVGDRTVSDPVRGVWDSSGVYLNFHGTQLPDYVSRWWSSGQMTYRDAGDLPRRLTLHLKDDQLKLKLDAAPDGSEGTILATVKDHDWEPGQDVHRLRPTIPELFHFCDQRYYVVRLWFLWLDKRIGPKHEVPDAERIDVLFDVNLKPEPVPAMGTDFHYRETWGRLKPGEVLGKVELGLGFSSLDDFARKSLVAWLRKRQVDDPARAVSKQLCSVVKWQKGPQAHVPLLTNVDLMGHVTSGDVRKG